MATFSANHSFFRLLPAGADTPSLAADRIVQLDADFERAGAWSGVTELIESAFQESIQLGRQDLIDAHHYELHMALPRQRKLIPLKYACLTEAAMGAERTRNFPLDRAYRVVNGLLSFVQQWKALHPQQSWLIVVHNFCAAQHLANRFFIELARRLSKQDVIVCVEMDAGIALHDIALPVTVELHAAPDIERLNLSRPEPTRLSAEECRQLESTATSTMECWETIYPPLLRHYRDRGDERSAARVALRAICLYNHYGYYHESASFADTVLPYFDALIGDDQAARWNYIGNIFQGLATTGREREALELIETKAVAQLTQPVLRAKMYYLLAMIHARYLKPHDIPMAEKYILAAIDAVELARPTIAAQDHAFLHVFIRNGLAFVRVRENRFAEALQLCEMGFDYLTGELGDDKHRLHRSVLLYNSAQVYTLLGKHERALEAYAQSIAMDPYYSEYYNESGNVLQQLGRHQEALENYDHAIRYSAPYPEVYYNKAVCQSRIDELEPALQSLTHSEELNPLQPEVYSLKAEILDELGRTDEAYTAYCKALELAPNSITARVNRAVLSYGRDDLEQALADMNHVIAIDADESSHYENRAAVYEALGQTALAQKDRRRVEQMKEAA